MQLTLTIEFHGEHHHGSGFGVIGLVDRALRRDGEGRPYLAGSAIKGRYRQAAMRLLRARGEDVCANDPACGSCEVCLVFGSPRAMGRCIFADAQLEAAAEFDALNLTSELPAMASGSQVRATTAIDRLTRGSRPQHLFTTETVAGFSRYVCCLEGDLSTAQVEVLQDASKVLETFGSGSSRGLGFCTYSLTEIKMGSEKAR